MRIYRRIIALIPAVIALTVNIKSLAQLEEKKITVFNDQQGYDSPETICVFTDSRGFLWIGGNNGICKFDGRNFITFDKTHGLLDNQIGSITETKNGDLLIGTKSGFCLFNGKKFNRIPLIIPKQLKRQNRFLPPFIPKSFFKTSSGTIYAMYQHGLAKFDEKKGTLIQDPEITFSAIQMTKAKKGQLFVTTSKGLFVNIGQNWAISCLNKAVNGAQIISIETKKNGEIYLGTTNGIFIRKLNGQVKHLSTTSNNVQDFYETSNGDFYAAGSMSVFYEIQNEKVTAIDLTEQLASAELMNITEDFQHNIWLATTSGLVKLSESPVKRVTRYPQINAAVSSLATGPDNQLFIGTLNGLFSIQNGKTEHILPSVRPDDTFITAISYGFGKMWIGTFSGNLYTYQNKKLKLISSSAVSQDCIYSIIPTSDLDAWIAYGSKIVHLKKGKETTYHPSPLYSQSVFLDNKKQVWIANLNILAIIKDGKLKEVLNNKKYSGYIALQQDKLNNYWIGTYGNGVLIKNKNKTTQITKEDGLANNFVSSMIYDKEKNVMWVGTMYGISKVNLSSNCKVNSIENFLNSSTEGSFGCVQNALVKLPNGNIFFSVGDQLMEYVYPNKKAKTAKIRIGLKTVSVNNRVITPNANEFSFQPWQSTPSTPSFNFNENNVSFESYAIDFNNGPKDRFSWKLVGYDKEWSDYSERNYINYTNLPDGNYDLLVRAVDQKGKYSSVFHYPFRIKTPYFKQWWFIGSLIIVLLLTTWFISNLRIKRIKKEEELKSTQFKKLAQAELKALRAQMNPHFMFNTLNAIQHAVLNKPDEKARSYFADFAKLLRQMLENSTKKHVRLEEEIEFLMGYLNLEKMRFGDRLNFTINVDTKIDIFEVKLPVMLIQPFVENAINHGILHKEDGGKVNLEFKVIEKGRAHFLSIIIEDDGIGREAAGNMHKTFSNEHTSISTANILERIELINAMSGNTNCNVTITDLTDGENAVGTRVELLLLIDDDTSHNRR